MNGSEFRFDWSEQCVERFKNSLQFRTHLTGNGGWAVRSPLGIQLRVIVVRSPTTKCTRSPRFHGKVYREVPACGPRIIVCRGFLNRNYQLICYIGGWWLGLNTNCGPLWQPFPMWVERYESIPVCVCLPNADRWYVRDCRTPAPVFHGAPCLFSHSVRRGRGGPRLGSNLVSGFGRACGEGLRKVAVVCVHQMLWLLPEESRKFSLQPLNFRRIDGRCSRSTNPWSSSMLAEVGLPQTAHRTTVISSVPCGIFIICDLRIISDPEYRKPLCLLCNKREPTWDLPQMICYLNVTEPVPRGHSNGLFPTNPTRHCQFVIAYSRPTKLTNWQWSCFGEVNIHRYSPTLRRIIVLVYTTQV